LGHEFILLRKSAIAARAEEPIHLSLANCYFRIPENFPSCYAL
jgi:hypothetical protein